MAPIPQRLENNKSKFSSVRLLAKFKSVPQGLKADWFLRLYGIAKAMPLQNQAFPTVPLGCARLAVG